MKHSAPSAAVISDLCVARCCFVLNQGASPSEQQRRSRFISCLKEIPKPCWQNRRKIRTLISLGNKGRRPSCQAISKGLSPCRPEAGQNSRSNVRRISCLAPRCSSTTPGSCARPPGGTFEDPENHEENVGQW